MEGEKDIRERFAVPARAQVCAIQSFAAVNVLMRSGRIQIVTGTRFAQRNGRGREDASQGIWASPIGRGLGSIDTQLMDVGAVETREVRTLAPGGVAGFQKPLQTEKTEVVSPKFAS
jgi:hypothetical protein